MTGQLESAPKVSVIIPTYKHEQYVLQTLESVFSQSYFDYEVIVINDGSPDHTLQALLPLIDSNRIRYVEQANAGQAAARNRGLAEARGKFIAFLDDDDLWPIDKLEWQVKMLENDNQAVLVYGQMHLFDANHTAYQAYPGEQAPEGYVFEEFMTAGWIRSPGQTLIRTEVIKSVGGLDDSIWGTDDWDLWLSLAKQGRFRYQAKIALHYRCHSSNASRNFYRMYNNGAKVITKHLGRYAWIKNRHQWLAANNFLKSFTSGDGLQEVDKLLDAGMSKSALVALWHLLLIRPGLCKHLYLYRTIFRIIIQFNTPRVIQ